ncbi:TlpA disulfide reductase family protein [uncultured Algibacter sp.]|uniref:TlpA family protein disulfide reductase n=1 Tax=uncultured Algibacter sp. TaxID=298659 RepID=UPI003216D6E7
MKNLIYIVSIAIVFVSCKKEVPKDYVTLSGTISNQNSDSLVVFEKDIIKTINVNLDGTFSDTLKVKTGDYIIFDGGESAPVYLKNGYDLNITLDTKEFDETITFQGAGAEANNYLAKKTLLQEKAFNFEDLMRLDRANFNKKLVSIENDFKSLLQNTKNLDTAFVSSQEKAATSLVKELATVYEEKQFLLAMNGKESPKFVDYENYAGGSTSLEDLKGKYVYIDVWATWCGPCKMEIPFLKEVEKQYHNKNIEFVSISVDKEVDYDKWKTMITEKELSGIQLIADNDFKSTFVKDYKINGIPRFILIDPQGKIIDAEAPRPSNDKLIDLFKELNI